MSCKVGYGSVQKLLALYEADSSLFQVGEGRRRIYIEDDTDDLYERTRKCVLCSLLPFWQAKARSEQVRISSPHDLKLELPSPSFSINVGRAGRGLCKFPGNTVIPVPG